MTFCLKPSEMISHWYEDCDGDRPTANCLKCENHKSNQNIRRAKEMRLCNECKQDPMVTDSGLCISCNEGLIENTSCDLIEKDKRIAELEAKIARTDMLQKIDAILKVWPEMEDSFLGGWREHLGRDKK
jgi:hypothetical protein